MSAIIENERPALQNSLWTATANPSPTRPPLSGEAEADTVVIGGGFTGLCAALHIAEGGQNVILLEAETPGWGASGRNGGQVNPGLKPNPDDLLAEFGPDLGKRMVDRWGGGGQLVFDLIAKHSVQCDAAQVGFLRSGTTAKTEAKLKEIARQWRAQGADVDEVSKAEMASMTGTDVYEGGIIDRRGGNLQPLNYALGLADAAERAGAKIHGHSKAREVATEGDRVTVTTDAGQVTARRVLICTNAYTGDLAKPLGKTVVPVTSVQVATAPLSDNIARSILPQGHSPTDMRRLIFYFRKNAEGRFVMGGRGAMGEGSTRARQEELRRAALKMYPQLDDVEWQYAWGGNAAMTQTNLPNLHLIGPNILAGIGFNGRGVANATVMGTVLADWALGRPADQLDLPLTPLNPFPFHGLRHIGLGVTITALRVLDRFRL